MFTVHVFKNKLKKQPKPIECGTLDEARLEVTKALKLKSLNGDPNVPGKGANEWRGDSINGYSMGFSREDDYNEETIVEIRSPEWEAEAKADTEKANRELNSPKKCSKK